MKIVLEPGDKLEIEVEDCIFTIDYNQEIEELSVSASLPDTDGREDKIYSERYGEAHEKLESELRKA